MNGSNARPEIKGEYEEAKKTARVYLRAVGVLGPNRISPKGYREREERAIRDTILRGGKEVVELPIDPLAVDAAILGYRCLHHGYDPGILEVFRKRARCHPGYGAALGIIALRMQEMGADMPDWLRVWEPGSESDKKKRWSGARARRYRIGMVVGVMETGSNILVRHGENEREREQLQWDLQAAHAAAGESLGGLSIEDALESVNKMRARRRHPDQRKRLTERNLVELTKHQAPATAGVEAIVPETEVRKHFPNLKPTSGEPAKNRDRAYSICDAVAEVLQEELPRRSRAERERPWDRTVSRAWEEYRNRHFLCEK